MPSRKILWLVALTCSIPLALSVHASLRGAAPEAGSALDKPVLASRMLTGTIKAANGEALEGITVSARGKGKTITVSVFTDARGAYVFPPLDGGSYRVWAQAVGLDASQVDVSIDPKQERRQDFTLKTVKDFTMQLNGAQWMAGLPEDTTAHRRMKEVFQGLCTSCHVPQFVLQNRFDEAGWRKIITAMETFGSTGTWSKRPQPVVQHYKEEMAAYLAEMRGPGPSPMKFDTPDRLRPKGEATRVVITEYDVPPGGTPDQLVPHNGSDWAEGAPSAYAAKGLHDTVPDLDGNAWINNSIPNKNRTYARVDAKTGQVTNFTVPGGADGYVRGAHSMQVAPDGVIWMDVYPARVQESEGTAPAAPSGESIARVDPRTGKVELFDPPKGMTPMGDFVAVDGLRKIWGVTRQGAIRFDPETKKFTDYKVEKVGNYDVAGDLDGNGWWAGISHDTLGVAEFKTGKVTEIQLEPSRTALALATPEDRKFYETLGGVSTVGANIGILGAQAPRRLGADPSLPILWVANWFGQNLAEVNIRSRKVTYHPVPMPYSSPYDVEVDKNHVVYVSLRNADSVGRFDPGTKQWTIYRLPTQGVEARMISVDRVRGDVWLPYWRTSKVGRLQFRTEQDMRVASR